MANAAYTTNRESKRMICKRLHLGAFILAYRYIYQMFEV